MSHALEQIHAAGIGVICKSASIAPHFLLARLQGYSFQLVIQLVCPAYILQLPSICVLLTAFKTFCWNKRGILPGTSLHFSNISSDISAPWARERTSLDLKKTNGMLASNDKRIFCNNVTCFGTKKCCCDRSHLQGKEWARVLQLLLTSCLQGSKGTVFNLFSHKSFPHTPYSFPPSVSCRLLSRHSVRTSWEFALEQVGISPTYQETYLLRGRVKELHLISIRPMECWLATIDASSAIMAHALEQIHAAAIGVTCKARSEQECFNCSSLLACKAPRVQFSICFLISLSRIHLTASLHQCPADCSQDILFEQAGNSHWNKLASLQHIKWHICSVGAWKYLTWH